MKFNIIGRERQTTVACLRIDMQFQPYQNAHPLLELLTYLIVEEHFDFAIDDNFY